MNHIFSKYKLQMIKEESHKYEVENKINGPKDAETILRQVLGLHLQSEEVVILICLDTKNKVIGIFETARGTLCSSLINPREIFKRAILCNSKSIILSHNHPSGDSSPSKEDILVTNSIKEAGKLLDIQLLDHIIIGENQATSLKEKYLV